MEMMNRAIEDATDFRGMMGKIEARAAQQAVMRRLVQSATEGDATTAGSFIGMPDRQPGENRADHRARLKRERRAANRSKVGT